MKEFYYNWAPFIWMVPCWIVGFIACFWSMKGDRRYYED